MTREEALAELQQPLYDPVELEKDREFVLKKLGMEREEFDRIMRPPNKSFKDYPSHRLTFQLLKRLRRVVSA
jgi:hypothetical protein